MWLIVIFYFIYLIHQIIILVKTAMQNNIRKNVIFGMVEVLEDIALFFILLFYAIESIGFGWYLSVVIMVLCNISKRILKKRTASLGQGDEK